MTTIKDVIVKEPKGRIWYLIVDADGVKYSTKNMILAALAQRLREKKARVEMQSFGGWYYRELFSIKEEGKEAVA